MVAKLITKRTSISSVFGVMRAPVSFILDRLEESKQQTARNNIWKLKEVKHSVKYDRRLLDIAMFNFDDTYLIGIEIIDHQHKIIMLTYNNIVNEAQSLRRNPHGTSIITKKFGPLFNMIGEHFSDEEKIMRDSDYPGLLEHICQHDQFMCDTLSILTEADLGNVGFEQILFVIGAWISGHILISDKNFGEFLKLSLKY